MISSYFYPAPTGDKPRLSDDWRTPAKEDQRPRQLSLLDWMLQRDEPEAWIKED